MNIIAIGDSLTEGYVTKETAWFFPYTNILRKMVGIGKVKNIGMSGKTAYAILQNLKIQKLSNFDSAIVLSGTNDLINKTSDSIFEWNKKIHLHCLDNSINRVYVLSLPQIISLVTYKPIQEDKRLQLNKLLKDWCKTNDKLIYVPFGEIFKYTKENNNWAHNGYHLSRSGYANMARFIYTYLIF